MKPHVFHPEASEEYTEAVHQYADITPELGGRFYDAVEGLIQEVCHHPERFFRCDYSGAGQEV